MLQTEYNYGISYYFTVFYKLMLGNSSPFDELEAPGEVFAFLFYFLTTIISVIMMLNLLIAIITTSYSEIAAKNIIAYHKNRMKIIIEIDENNVEEAIINNCFGFGRLNGCLLEIKNQ